MSERRIDALSRRIWRELYRVPVRLPVLRVLFQRLMKAQRPPHHCAEVREMIDRGDDPGIVLAQEREQRLGAAQ